MVCCPGVDMATDMPRDEGRVEDEAEDATGKKTSLGDSHATSATTELWDCEKSRTMTRMRHEAIANGRIVTPNRAVFKWEK